MSRQRFLRMLIRAVGKTKAKELLAKHTQAEIFGWLAIGEISAA